VGLHIWDGTWNIRWIYVFLVSFISYSFSLRQSSNLPGILRYWIIPTQGNFTENRCPYRRPGHLFGDNRRDGQKLPILPGTVRLMLGGSIIYILGFIDDIHPLPATPRLLIQIIACLIVIKAAL